MEDKNIEHSKDTERYKDIVLTITLNSDGVNVSGPIRNEPIALWMLEKAKDTIKAHNLLESQPKVQPAGGIMNFAKRFRR